MRQLLNWRLTMCLQFRNIAVVASRCPVAFAGLTPRLSRYCVAYDTSWLRWMRNALRLIEKRSHGNENARVTEYPCSASAARPSPSPTARSAPGAHRTHARNWIERKIVDATYTRIGAKYYRGSQYLMNSNMIRVVPFNLWSIVLFDLKIFWYSMI